MKPFSPNGLRSIAPRRGLALAIVGLLAAGGCHFYQVGNQEMYCANVQTVYVEMFESDSFRKFLGQRLTEAVVKEIELNTPMRITERSLAQSILRGRLIRDRKRVLTETINDDPRDIQVDFLLEVTWTDPAGNPLMTRQVLRLDRAVDFIPEGGPSLTTAEQELINRLARQIVQQMEMPW